LNGAGSIRLNKKERQKVAVIDIGFRRNVILSIFVKKEMAICFYYIDLESLNETE
jgi:hypothetical protein